MTGDDDDSIATHIARDDEAKEAGRREERARTEKALAAAKEFVRAAKQSTNQDEIDRARQALYAAIEALG